MVGGEIMCIGDYIYGGYYIKRRLCGNRTIWRKNYIENDIRIENYVE